MHEDDPDLSGSKVLAAINGLELFGQELGNIEVFQVLRTLGAEVIVGVNAAPVNNTRERLERLGFETFRLPFGPQWSKQWVRKNPTIALIQVLAVLRCSHGFRQAISRLRPTHIHLGSALVYSYVALALTRKRIPLVYRAGDAPPFDSPFNLRIWRMAMATSTHTVAISEFVRDKLMAGGVAERNITVIHNYPPTRPDSQLSDHGLPNTPQLRHVVYVGAIAEHKGLLVLLEAFERVARTDATLRLDILGGSRYDDSFRQKLFKTVIESKLQNRVTFLGHIDDPAPYYRRAAVHVVPSIWEEPSANVVLEAKREGTPSIVFPSGGLPEAVRHEIDGYICAGRSPKDLSEAMNRMLADPARLQRMGTAAKVDAEQRFGRTRFERTWAGVYRSVRGTS